MAKNHYNFNPQKHDLIVGVTKVSDYAEDVKFDIEYEDDFRDVIVGVDGDTTTSEHHNRNAIITMKILQSSPLNILFTKLASSELEFPVAHVDRNFNGDIGAFASKAHFIKPAKVEVGKTSKSREWKIRAINLKQATDLI